jgi:hypothetical protein
VEQALERFEGADGFAGPSEVNLAVGPQADGLIPVTIRAGVVLQWSIDTASCW